jgi:hypothetical protein
MMASSGYPTSSNATFGVGRNIEGYSIPMKFIAIFLSYYVLVGAARANDADHAREKSPPAHVQQDDNGFYLANSEAEKTLAKILFITDNDREFTTFAFKKPWLKKATTSKLKHFFSLSLQKAWVDAQVNALKENCDGKYIDGELCGLGFNPLTCAQDYNEKGYLYKTLAEDDAAAIISYMWPHIPETAATFRMIRQKGQWIVDGVSCGSIINPTYNFKF